MCDVKETACFQQVAEVIGEELAERELLKARTDWEENMDSTLTQSFVWNDSPQGHGFWRDIDEGEVPYGLSKPDEESLEKGPAEEGLAEEPARCGARPEGPQFGDLLHSDGEDIVFIRVDGDGDYVCETRGGTTWYLDLEEIDEYRTEDTLEARSVVVDEVMAEVMDWIDDHLETSVIDPEKLSTLVVEIAEQVNLGCLYIGEDK